MSARLFSVTRRRPNIVDVYTPKLNPDIPTQKGYRLKAAPNFDVAMTTIIDLPPASKQFGFLDRAVDQRVLDVQNNPNRVRIVFDPDTFATGEPIDAGLEDTKPFWLQFFPLDAAGAEIGASTGAPTLVLPDAANHGIGLVTIAGTAPSGADTTASLQLDLPRLMEDFRIVNNEGATSLFVSMERDGAEVEIDPTTPSPFFLDGTQPTLFVRGGGATASFSATFTLAFPR